jgi:hypothetical protein
MNSNGKAPFTLISAWIAPLLCLLFIPACALANITSTQLIGTWRCIDGARTGDYTFRKDGTYLASVSQNHNVVWEGAGNWSLDGNTIQYILTRSSLSRIPVGMKDADHVTQITSTYYLVASPDGTTHKYLRMPAFETTSINIGYTSQDKFGQRVTVLDCALYIKQLQAVCTNFFAQATIPEDLDIVVIVKPAGHSRVWFISSSTLPTSDQREPLRKALEAVPPPTLKDGPIGFAIEGSIAGGTGNRLQLAAPVPVPNEWHDILSKQKGPLYFDELVTLVWPD